MELVRRLITAAKHEKIKRIIGVMSKENEAMQKLCRKAGFSSFSSNAKTGMIEATLLL